MSREMSHWGWGHADRFADIETRRGLAAQAGQLLGFDLTREPAEPTPLAAISLARSRLTPPASLRQRFDDSVSGRVRHAQGKGYPDLLRGFSGDFRRAPDWVAQPENEGEVADIINWCGEQHAALVPYGGGTSVVDGIGCDPATAGTYSGVVCVDLQRLDRVLEVDELSSAARIQAGALGPVLNAQLADAGFQLRHFPQSYEFSTLGGWLATRAGGHYATLYTHIDDFVEALRMLTPVGPWESRRLPGSGAGPSPDRMVLGSEGTLGIITEAWMRVQRRPRWRASASVHFADFAAAVVATRKLAQSGLYPTNCRLLDGREAMLNGVMTSGRAVLIVGFESADHSVEDAMRRAIAITAAEGGECSDGPRFHQVETPREETAASSWRDAFFEAPYLRDTLISLGVIVDTFETACTWDRFDALHGAIREQLRGVMRDVCGAGVVSSRFSHVYSDGPVPYYTFIAPGRAGAELEQWQQIKEAANRILLEHGGTITHHHGIGRMHKAAYHQQRPELFGRALGAAKGQMDPGGIMNPGVLL